jgi:hypothetical protein
MVKKCGFQPEHVSVAGYAQYHPVAVNATEAGRRRNRRIDFVVVASAPETSTLGELPHPSSNFISRLHPAWCFSCNRNNGKNHCPFERLRLVYG